MFSRKSLGSLAPLMASSLHQTMARWEQLADSRKVVQIDRELGILSVKVLQETMFGSSLSDQELAELVDQFRLAAQYMGGLMGTYWAPEWFPVPHKRNGQRAVAIIHRVFDRLIDARRADPTDDPDLLSLLLGARYEDTGEPIADHDLRDELMGLWIGGSDTTSSALVWSLAFLAQNPEHAETLRAEADDYDGDFDSWNETKAMQFAKAVFDESQRLQGSSLLSREAQHDAEIAGYDIAAGSQVGLCAYTLSRHPDYWDDPDRFDPHRWLDESRKPDHPFQFVMFGGGPRHCVGSGMAYLEGQFALTMIAKRFHIQPEPGFDPKREFHLAVGIKGGMSGTIRARTHTGV